MRVSIYFLYGLSDKQIAFQLLFRLKINLWTFTSIEKGMKILKEKLWTDLLYIKLQKYLLLLTDLS